MSENIRILFEWLLSWHGKIITINNYRKFIITTPLGLITRLYDSFTALARSLRRGGRNIIISWLQKTRPGETEIEQLVFVMRNWSQLIRQWHKVEQFPPGIPGHGTRTSLSARPVYTLTCFYVSTTHAKKAEAAGVYTGLDNGHYVRVPVYAHACMYLRDGNH